MFTVWGDSQTVFTQFGGQLNSIYRAVLVVLTEQSNSVYRAVLVAFTEQF